MIHETEHEEMRDKSRYMCCSRLVNFDRPADSRLVSSYAPYQFGRYLAICGSIGLLLGLLLKFIFFENKHLIYLTAITIICLSLLAIMFGAVAICWSAHQAKSAQTVYEDDRRLRPDSVMSTTSYLSEGSSNRNSTTVPTSSNANRTDFMFVSSPLSTLNSSNANQTPDTWQRY